MASEIYRHLFMIRSRRLLIVGGFFVICLFISQRVPRYLDDVVPKKSNRTPFYTDFINVTSATLQVQQAATKRSNATMVLVLTYMRSGSSLTGDILQHSPGAFYVYEPLRGLSQKNLSSFVIRYANGTERFPPYSYMREVESMISNWFQCNIDGLPYIGLMDSFMNKGLKTSTFHECLRRNQIRADSLKRLMKFCKAYLYSMCKSSPIRIIKTIRVPLTQVRNLLKELPSLKIIHLVRDPRATLASQARFGMCSIKNGGWYACTSKYCTARENDFLEFEVLKNFYPDRLLEVQYESIATDPIQTSRTMFDFIGSEMTPETRDYIYNITQAGNPNNCPICTTRSNSSEHIDTWKKKMPRDFIDIVNERCNFVLKSYGYDLGLK